MGHHRSALDALRDHVKRVAENNPEDTYRRAGYDGELKPQSDRLVGLCPFHTKTTPSFTLYADGGFYCFGCDACGDIIAFYQRTRTIPSFPESIALLAEDLGIAVEETRTRPKKRAGNEESWSPYTADDYAAHALLPAEALKRWGVCDSPGGHVLIFYRDQDGRNLRYYVTLDEFVKENFILSEDSRSNEKFMHGIKVLMAKNYVDNLSEEASKGMREKAEQGT